MLCLPRDEVEVGGEVEVDVRALRIQEMIVLFFIHSVFFDEGREFDEVCFSNSFFEHNDTNFSNTR